jgi:hypothetical protein
VLFWPEIGRHKVTVTLAGEPVPGSPFYVSAQPQDVFLPTCQIYGPGLTHAVTGEKTGFSIEARDSR